MKLYAHQKAIIDADPKWCGIFQGTGSAKTRTALELAKGKTLVIVPKQQKLDRTWENNAEKFNITIDMTVVSKEEFRRDFDIQKKETVLSLYETVIVDEAHNFFGVTPETRQVKRVPIPKTSEMFRVLAEFIHWCDPARFYLLSATPASKPMNVWAIATLLGREWDYFRFRDTFYFQLDRYHIPKNSKELKDRLAMNVKKLGYTGGLDSFFDVPAQSYKTVHFDLTDHQKTMLKDLRETEADPMSIRAKTRTIENGCLYDMGIVSVDNNIDKTVRRRVIIDSEKIPYILERAEEFPKMLIFANYIAQIDAIADALKKKNYKVFCLTGQTKDRGKLISTAEESERCIVIAQCGISSGYELKSINCVIFASKSYRYLDYDQACGRVLRADALKKNLYIHLVVKGGMDELCHEAIMAGKDFQEKIMS